MPEKEVQEAVEIEVRTIDLQGKGFWPKYRRIIQMKEVFMNTMAATVADADAAFEFLKDHITKPETDEEKTALLNELETEQFLSLFEKIGGGSQTAVPPVSGADSEDTSE